MSFPRVGNRRSANYQNLRALCSSEMLRERNTYLPFMASELIPQHAAGEDTDAEHFDSYCAEVLLPCCLRKKSFHVRELDIPFCFKRLERKRFCIAAKKIRACAVRWQGSGALHTSSNDFFLASRHDTSPFPQPGQNPTRTSRLLFATVSWGTPFGATKRANGTNEKGKNCVIEVKFILHYCHIQFSQYLSLSLSLSPLSVRIGFCFEG